MRTFMTVLLVVLAVMLVAAACSSDDSLAGDLDGGAFGGYSVENT